MFVLLTVPVFFAIVAVNYVSNEKIARDNADELVERFGVEAVENIQHLFDPIKSLVRSAASIGTEQPDFYEENRSLKYLFSILQHSDRIISMYVGLTDGVFRQARQIDPSIEIQGKLPPVGTAVRRPVDHAATRRSPRSTTICSSTKTARNWAAPSRPRPTIRVRACGIVTAQQSGELSVSDVDVFAALGLVGFTVGAPFYVDGGAAWSSPPADITLDGLSNYLSERKISPGTLSYILDHQGRVIANSERAKILCQPERQGRAAAHHLDRQRPAGHRLQLPAARQREDVHLQAWRQELHRQPDDLAAGVRQEVAALRHHAARRFHPRIRRTEQAAGPVRRDRHPAADLHHLFPLQRRLLRPSSGSRSR